MEFEDRALNEVCYFVTARGQYIVVKSPEYASQAEMDYIASFYQEYEDAVCNEGINTVTGKSHAEYMDLDSSVI